MVIIAYVVVVVDNIDGFLALVDDGGDAGM